MSVVVVVNTRTAAGQEQKTSEKMDLRADAQPALHKQSQT